MKERFTFEVPSEFTDEERWLKIFNTKQGIIAAITLAVVSVVTKFFMAIGLWWLGLLLALPFIAIVGVLIFFPVPEERYLQGGGMKLDQVLYRVLLRRMYGCIYVRNYEMERRIPKWMFWKSRII